ncbi:MAG: hypothetical protein JWO86_7093 [Myxococcaceae bacterium]|nr:hypothetical protein [Myxococcaceae bacterium]
MSIQQEAALSTLFGVPLDAMMKASNIRALQKTVVTSAPDRRSSAAARGACRQRDRPLDVLCGKAHI